MRVYELEIIDAGPRHYDYARIEAVFGASRLAIDRSGTPSVSQIDELNGQVEVLCTDRLSNALHGVHRRDITNGRKPKDVPIELMWNPAGVIGGFGIDPLIDGAVAGIRNLKIETEAASCGPFRIPGWHRSTESMFVDQISGRAFVVRSISRTYGGTVVRDATKPATSVEVQSASRLLSQFEEIKTPSAERPSRPVYLEIGFGLDPSSLRGTRKFMSKTYVGLDLATGEYENPVGNYADAVLDGTSQFEETVGVNRSDEHIYFTIADAARIPLPDDSVTEMFMSNVVNAPIDDKSRKDILCEARRVIKPAGSLVARVNWHQDEWPERTLDALLHTHRFGYIRHVSKDDVEYARLDRLYGKPETVVAPEGYYLIAEKV